MRNVYKALAVAVLFTAICGTVACSGGRQLHREEALRKDLFVLRSEIDQFTLDHQRPPNSLAELVRSGYLTAIPTDPFTGRKDTWKVERAGDLLDVHSGSDGLASDGTRYSSW